LAGLSPQVFATATKMKEFVFFQSKAPWMATAAAVIIGGVFFGVFCGLGLAGLKMAQVSGSAITHLSLHV